MWLVRIALSRPYTFIVLALMLLIIGPLAISRTPTDIFPDINIPVVSVVWSFSGLPPQQMADLVTSVFERAATTTVNDIEHLESESLIGVSVTKIFFHTGVDIAVALSQVTAIAQTLLKQLPPGQTPPLVLSYNAATVPVLQLILSSQTLPEQDLNDLGNNFIRTQLATVQGAALPFAYGGKVRQVQVDLHPEKMQTYGISAQDISAVIGTQNLIFPAGTEKIGLYEYLIKLNASPLSTDEFNNFPIKALPDGGVLYVRDVAHVRDGFTPQTNIVTVNGQRAVMMSVQKTGNASTLDIVSRVKAMIPALRSMMPSSLSLTTLGDQSIFVLAAIDGVIKEGIIAACLTGLMILIVLGSWQSTFIIALSIPLSILASLTILSALGETINIMTLGGLALAVGILVDDATVAIENINWNLEQGKEVEQAILDGAEQIAIPALVSTLCICIVFVPMFFLGGVAQYLFAPLAEAVIFAMLASYILSRTLVATLAKYLLKKHENFHSEEDLSRFQRFHAGFERGFERFRQSYLRLLTKSLENRKVFILSFLAFILVSIALLAPWLGSNFFPSVDAGQIKLHFQSPTGTRVEESARLAGEIGHVIRGLIPKEELDSIVANIGLPTSGINISYSNSATNAASDADILIALKENHKPSDDYVRELRPLLQKQFPGVTFSFLPADIVNQTLNFGLPSAIDIQIIGLKQEDNLRYASKLLARLQHVPGVVDAHLRQAFNYPGFLVESNRSRARELGYSQFDIANNLLITLSSSFQTAPTFWVNPKNHISYPVATQTPQYYMNSLQALQNITIANATKSADPQILGAMVHTKRTMDPVVVSHYNVQPVIDIFASIQDSDLGSVAKAINKIVDDTKKEVPVGSSVVVRGQIDTKDEAFNGLYFGLIFSILLVYLLIVINFQSWLDPFIIITALPAALAGIVWMLFLTHTTLSVPALTGAIMCMGVATSNGILVISFARDHMKEGHDPFTSALEAGKTRIRPVLMTAVAMIIGMFPMALGLGDGGEQNAPLGRAVIGGLSFATIATLFFVPTIFCLIHGRKHKREQGEAHV